MNKLEPLEKIMKNEMDLLAEAMYEKALARGPDKSVEHHRMLLQLAAERERFCRSLASLYADLCILINQID